jgi:gamma-glutamyl-gamma-aminobutyrate hydrolase PuuD
MKLRPLASHHFGLARTGEAFALQAARADGIIKAIIHP